MTEKKLKQSTITEELEKRDREMYQKAKRKIKEKDKDWLGDFLGKFSTEGGFWLKDKFKKDDWL